MEIDKRQGKNPYTRILFIVCVCSAIAYSNWKNRYRYVGGTKEITINYEHHESKDFAHLNSYLYAYIRNDTDHYFQAFLNKKTGHAQYQLDIRTIASFRRYWHTARYQLNGTTIDKKLNPAGNKEYCYPRICRSIENFSIALSRSEMEKFTEHSTYVLILRDDSLVQDMTIDPTEVTLLLNELDLMSNAIKKQLGPRQANGISPEEL